MVDTVQTEGIENKRYTIGICYAVIPSDVDRDTYVQNCFRKGVISVLCDDGSYLMDLPIDINVLQNIDFPANNISEEQGELGSCLVYGNEYLHNKPIIIGRLLKNDEATNLTENEFRLEKFTNNGEVSISGNAKDGNLFVNVSGKTDKGGKMFINVSGPENEGEINVNLKGNLNVELQSATLNVLNDFFLKSKNNVNIYSKEGVVNLGNEEESEDGLEPLLLGNKTVEQLSKEIKALTDLLQSIANITPQVVPANAIDPTWAVWQSAVASITDRGSLGEVKSEKTFTE
jgi:hypothetical protein